MHKEAVLIIVINLCLHSRLHTTILTFRAVDAPVEPLLAYTHVLRAAVPMAAAAIVAAEYGCCEATTQQPHAHRQQSSMSGDHDSLACLLAWLSSRTIVKKTVVTVFVIIIKDHYHTLNRHHDEQK